MKRFKKLVALFLTLALCTALLCPVCTASAGQSNLKNRVVGYFPSYRTQYIDSIDYSALSHIILSFITYNNGTLSCAFTSNQINKIKAYCEENDVKFMIGVGGWDGFTYSTSPFASEDTLEDLVDQIMSYVDTYGFDGIDIDIELTKNDYWNYFDEFSGLLRERLDEKEGRILTTAVAPWMTSGRTLDFADYDFLNLMTYDSGETDLAPLSQVATYLSEYHDRCGVSYDKLVIGTPFYGYKGSTAYTYGQIIAISPEARFSDSYDDIYYSGEASTRAKAEYALNYGGIMIWEIGQDSFTEYSLLSAIKDVYTNTASDSVDPVTGLYASNINGSSLTLNWTASANAASYNVYSGSTLLGNTTSASYNVTGLTAGSSYTFKVAAVSASGDVSSTVSINIATASGDSSVSAYDETVAYTQGDKVVYNGSIYVANYWTRGDIPASGSAGSPWSYVGAAETALTPVTAVTLYKNGTAVQSGTEITVLNTDSAISFTAAVTPDDATNKGVTLTVDNTDVALVYGNTVSITPSNTKEDTSVTVTAMSSEGGFIATYTVNISAPIIAATGITLYQNGFSVKNGGSMKYTEKDSTITFTAVVSPSTVTNKNYTITVSDTTVGKVSGGTAIITPANATADTSVVITATSEDGAYTAYYTVNIDYTEPEQPEPTVPDAYVFKVGDKNAYWTTYSYAFTCDVPCRFVDSVTYVPFRIIATAAGASDITYADGNVQITNKTGYVYNLTIASKDCTLTYEGTEYPGTLNSAPQFIDGVCCLPVRDVSNITGASVAFVSQNGAGYVIVSESELSSDETATVIAAYEAAF